MRKKKLEKFEPNLVWLWLTRLAVGYCSFKQSGYKLVSAKNTIMKYFPFYLLSVPAREGLKKSLIRWNFPWRVAQ